MEFPRIRISQRVALAWSISGVLILALVYILAVPVGGAAREVAVTKGQGVDAIARTLKGAGVVRSSLAFSLLVRALGEAGNLHAGRYIINPRTESIWDIAMKMAGGKAEPEDIGVLIYEGMNVWEIDRQLAAVGFIARGAFAKEWYQDEGTFFPDTYRFLPGTTVAEMGRVMQENFRAKAGFPRQDTLIIASMLEKEGKTQEELELIAGVIQNRIKRNMPLQLDATVIYGACMRSWKAQGMRDICDVTDVPVGREVVIDSPFNTYTRMGLPEGPIANPGALAIKAAEHPKASKYLYYLSPRSGSHVIFAETYAEHVRNRAKYLGI
ncbi:MAG: endolytic transglycosylase MltG [Patescibacteria group bacterium]